jgi:enoyl-CoA hydratase
MSVRVEKKDRVATVILDRAAVKNAVDGATARALHAAFVEVDADAEVDVAVLWGANGTFCAGADLKALASDFEGERRLKTLDAKSGGPAPMGPTHLLMRKPTIAAVSGYAVAGGMELALWCDLRVVEENATFGIFCRRFGVPLIDGGTVRLPRLIGMSRAMDLMLTGRPVDAAEALAMGLANRVVPAGTAREAAEALARQIAQAPQECLRNDRQSAYQQWDLPLDEALWAEVALGLRTLESGETLQGAARFAGGAGRHGKLG